MKQTPSDELPDHLYIALYQEGMLPEQNDQRQAFGRFDLGDCSACDDETHPAPLEE